MERFVSIYSVDTPEVALSEAQQCRPCKVFVAAFCYMQSIVFDVKDQITHRFVWIFTWLGLWRFEEGVSK
jgi:hypothetical protein